MEKKSAEESGPMDIPRWLQLQEQIDYLYFVISEIQKTMPKSPIDQAVDEATGYDAERRKQLKEALEEMVRLKTEWMQVTGEETSLEMERQMLEMLK